MLWLLSFILSGVISPLISSSILCTYRPGEFLFQYSFCLFMLVMGFSRQEHWNGLPFPSPVDPILSDLSTMTRPSWVAPHGMAWFHWVRQGCGPGIRLAGCLWLWFQCLCSLSAYGFLLPWMWGISSRLLQQRAHKEIPHILYEHIRKCIYIYIYKGRILDVEHMLALKNQNDFTWFNSHNSAGISVESNWAWDYWVYPSFLREVLFFSLFPF